MLEEMTLGCSVGEKLELILVEDHIVRYSPLDHFKEVLLENSLIFAAAYRFAESSIISKTARCGSVQTVFEVIY